MKEIRGHRSWNQDEIIGMLVEKGSYTCPTLPHYRYDRVKAVCRALLRLSLVQKTGTTDVSMNLKPTPAFREWQRQLAAGETSLGAVRWAKARAQEDVPPDVPAQECAA